MNFMKMKSGSMSGTVSMSMSTNASASEQKEGRLPGRAKRSASDRCGAVAPKVTLSLWALDVVLAQPRRYRVNQHRLRVPPPPDAPGGFDYRRVARLYHPTSPSKQEEPRTERV